jgi:hypothetical protein
MSAEEYPEEYPETLPIKPDKISIVFDTDSAAVFVSALSGYLAERGPDPSDLDPDFSLSIRIASNAVETKGKLQIFWPVHETSIPPIERRRAALDWYLFTINARHQFEVHNSPIGAASNPYEDEIRLGQAMSDKLREEAEYLKIVTQLVVDHDGHVL